MFLFLSLPLSLSLSVSLLSVIWYIAIVWSPSSQVVLVSLFFAIFVRDASEDKEIEKSAKAEINRMRMIGQYKGIPLFYLAHKLLNKTLVSLQKGSRIKMSTKPRHWCMHQKWVQSALFYVEKCHCRDSNCGYQFEKNFTLNGQFEPKKCVFSVFKDFKAD